MRKLGYVRVSTKKQLLDRQINQLRDHCDELFIEDAVSAVGKKRPVYQKAIKALESGDVFVVLSLDRAYRSVLDALSELQKLEERNIEFYSLHQNFDTRTPEGKLFFTICAAFAEWERNIISMRTLEGMEAAKARGARIGRPKKLGEEQISSIINQKRNLVDLKDIRALCKELKVSPRTLKRAIAA